MTTLPVTVLTDGKGIPVIATLAYQILVHMMENAPKMGRTAFSAIVLKEERGKSVN